MQIWPGSAYPLGATYDGSGTNFALFSEVAERVELCLFDADGAEVRHRPARGGRLRLARVPSRRRARPALRLSGARPYDPSRGHRCNPSKLLLDPYAKAIDGTIRVGPVAVLLPLRRSAQPQRRRLRRAMPKSVVINPFFDWGVDRPPKRQYAESVIYEAHVKGLTESASGDSGRTARDLRRHRPSGHHRSPALTRGHRHRADARASLRQRLDPDRQGLVELLGLQHDRRSSPPTASTARALARAVRCRSSRRWSARCTRRASKSSSTSSTTTPARATTWARRCASEVSTTPRITAWSTTIRSTTWTTPAPETRSTCGTRMRCS